MCILYVWLSLYVYIYPARFNMEDSLRSTYIFSVYLIVFRQIKYGKVMLVEFRYILLTHRVWPFVLTPNLNGIINKQNCSLTKIVYKTNNKANKIFVEGEIKQQTNQAWRRIFMGCWQGLKQTIITLIAIHYCISKI